MEFLREISRHISLKKLKIFAISKQLAKPMRKMCESKLVNWTNQFAGMDSMTKRGSFVLYMIQSLLSLMSDYPWTTLKSLDYDERCPCPITSKELGIPPSLPYIMHTFRHNSNLKRVLLFFSNFKLIPVNCEPH